MEDEVEVRTPASIVSELSAAVAIAMVKRLIDDGRLYERPTTIMGNVSSQHGQTSDDNAYTVGLVHQSAGLEFLTKEEYGRKIAKLSNELDNCLKMLYVEKI